jgi:hypothetical protein
MFGGQRLNTMQLETLIDEAMRYARFTMKKNSCLVPVMMAATPGDPLLAGSDDRHGCHGRLCQQGAADHGIVLGAWAVSVSGLRGTHDELRLLRVLTR